MADNKEIAKGYMELLTYSINQQLPELMHMASLQDSFDNKIDPANWPCQSQIPTGQHFVAVEEALGPAMDMNFPETNGLQLIPTDPNVDETNWRNAEWGLWTMLNYRMRLRDVALRSFKDCFKCGIGYGIVEPFVYTPDTGAEISIGGKSTRLVVTGDAQMSVRYRYISPGKIIPYPEGTDFNGPEATPLSFFLDSYPKWQLEKIIEQDKKDNGEETRFKASMAEIMEAANSFNSAGVTDFIMFAEKLGGRGGQWSANKDGKPDNAPANIPVIKIFEQPGKVTWIVPSTHEDGVVLMQQEADGMTRLRNTLVKFSAWPDGDRWFPTSAPGIDQKRGFASDLFLNFWFDMMTKAKDARLVVDKTALAPDQRVLDGFSDIYIEGGDARTAASYLDPPRIDPNMSVLGNEIKQLGHQIQGRRDMSEKNFTRGGTQAFSELLGTTQARQRLSALILESGGLTQVYQHVLAFMQDNVAQLDGGMTLSRQMYDAGSGTRHIENKTLTIEDLNHGYELVLDTTERRMLGGMSFQERRTAWQDLQDRDDVRPAEVNRIYPLPESVIRRTFVQREKQEKLQQENRDVAVTSQLAGIANTLGPPGQGTPAAASAQPGGLG